MLLYRLYIFVEINLSCVFEIVFKVYEVLEEEKQAGNVRIFYKFFV